MKEKGYYNKTGFVSNSSIDYFLKSPSLFKKYIDGDIAETTPDYQGYGKLVHLKILEPFVYDSEVVPFEYTTPKSPQQKKFLEAFMDEKMAGCDNLITAGIKCYREAYPTNKESDERVEERAKNLIEEFQLYRKYYKASKERTVIKTDLHEKIKESEKNVRGHKKANELIYAVSDMFDDGKREAYNELELYYVDEDNIRYKSMLDRLVIDHENKVIQLVDIKTSSHLPTFREHFDKYDYIRQLAFYTMMIRYNSEKLKITDEYKMDYFIVAISSITCEVKVFNVEQQEILDSIKRLTGYLEDIRWHFKNNRWDHSAAYYEGDGTETL